MKKTFQLMILAASSCALYINASPVRNNPFTGPDRNIPSSKKSSNVLTEHQIENYVQNIIASLFSNYNQQDQAALCKRITKKLLEKTDCEKNYNLPIERTTQDVYEQTIGGIVDYVERKSFDLAKKECGHHDTTVQVSKLIRNELEKKITTTGTFSQGALSDYLGKDLEYKVRNTCRLYYVPRVNVTKRYDEKNCRICFCHFSPSVPWVYISPCGHDMCKKCAEAYFILQNKQRCPVCGQAADTYQIRKSIQNFLASWY